MKAASVRGSADRRVALERAGCTRDSQAAESPVHAICGIKNQREDYYRRVCSVCSDRGERLVVGAVSEADAANEAHELLV